MVRPEQLLLSDDDAGAGADGAVAEGAAAGRAIPSVVHSYEYFGHDAVVRVQPDDAALPELVVRITGGIPLAPGTRVGVSVHGPVVVWPEPAEVSGLEAPESLRTTPA